MAVVYRARDERLRRLVAVKVMAPQWAADADFRQRFTAEARAATTVDHPHVIPVYEAGDANGVLFIAMRLVTGGDLLRVLRREQPLPPVRALDLLSPVASALDAAHAAGLVHRDIKPANILLDVRPEEPDHVYLSDFGLSKGALSGISLTQSGQYLGTPYYSAPEQARGDRVDGRADQYALACVAFELLAGRPPFERDQPLSLLLAHLTASAPALTERRPDLPAAADPVMARALAKAPDERYQSCLEFIEALRDALGLPPYQTTSPAAPAGTGASGRPGTVVQPTPAPGTVAAQRTLTIPARPPTGTQPVKADPVPGAGRGRLARRLRGRLPVIALAGAALAAAVAIPLTLAASGTPGPGPGSLRHAAAVVAKVTPGRGALLDTYAVSSGKDVNSVAFAPDGTTMVTADNSFGGRVYLWNTAAKKLTAVLSDPGGGGVASVAFAPDGTTLAAADNNGGTYVWNTATRKVTAVLRDPGSVGVASVAFAPGSSTTLAAGDGNGSTYIWDTSTKRITATLPEPISQGVTAVTFVPGGGLIPSLAGTLTTADVDAQGYLWDTKTSKTTATVYNSARGGVTSLAWASDGISLAVGNSNGNVYIWSGQTGTIIDSRAVPDGGSVTSVAWADIGSDSVLAFGGSNGTTYVWDTTKSAIIASHANPDGGSVTAVAFTPNGTTLATGDSNGTTYLWRVSPPPQVPEATYG
jgi:serine/threonine-protein kinase